MAGAEKLLIDADGAPLDRPHGRETEMSFKAVVAGTRGREETIGPAALLREAGIPEKRWYPDGGMGYIDVGSHPEDTTGETTSFAGTAKRTLAGLQRQAGEFAIAAAAYEKKTGRRVVVNLAANNCDDRGNTWASHNSYTTRRALTNADILAAFLVHNSTKIVVTGAGRVVRDVHAPRGFAYHLSQRAEFIKEETNNQTVSSRPLVNQRDEPLADADRFRRFHDTPGETVIAPLAQQYVSATASIVLRACEIGVDFTDLVPNDPVRAMKIISADPTLTALVDVGDKRYTGLDLQEMLLVRSIERAARRQYLTKQESEFGNIAIGMLDGLRDDPYSDLMLRSLDWPTKWRHIERMLASKKRNPAYSDFAVAYTADKQYPALLPFAGAGMQLVTRNAFIDSPTAAELAGDLPPADTRADLRGEVVRRLSGKPGVSYAVNNWRYLTLRKHGVQPVEQQFDLGDPFLTHHPRLEKFLIELEEYSAGLAAA